MAHVTLQLIWYRLGETRESMEELYQQALSWYAEFSLWKVDVIDFLFVFWIAFGIIVACLAQVYNKLFAGRSKPATSRTQNSSPRRRKPVGPVETCQWLNSVISWVYLNYNSTPEYVNAWIRGLNEQAKKHQGSLQIRFDRILAGSLPPRITNINTEPGPKDNFTLHGSLEASELGLQILVTEQTSSEVQLTNCDINVQLLKGEFVARLNVQSVLQKDDVHVFVRFEGEPEIVLLIKPHPKGEARVAVSEVDKLVKLCLGQTITHFKLHTSHFDQELQNQFFNHLGLHAPPKPPRTPEALLRQDKRLLVKVIKASGLGAKDMGCNDPYCTLEMDDPPQRHTTSVVRNAVNPFWDESFLFDINSQSRELLVEIFDSDRAPGQDFLGMAAVNVEELKRQPSSRHIIPLAGRQPGTGKGGNITVEFLFMDPADSPIDLHQDERDLMMATAANLSPRRRVETQRTVTPSGLILTTQTTTMDHGDNSINARSPTDSSPRSRGAGGKYATVPRDGNKPIPEIKVKSQMTSSTPTDDQADGRVSTASSERSNKPKRSSSLASTLRKRFNKVRKPRSHSADRAGREADRLRPPDQYASGSKSTEDMDYMDIPGQQTNLKKSKSLGSSLKKLFKGKKKAQKTVDGEQSRDSSMTRGGERLTPDQPASMGDNASYQHSPSPQPRRHQQRHSTSSAV